MVLCPKEPADPKTPLRKFALSRTLLPQLFAQFDAQSDAELFALLYTQAERAGRREKSESGKRPHARPGPRSPRIGIAGNAPLFPILAGNLVKMFVSFVLSFFVLFLFF